MAVIAQGAKRLAIGDRVYDHGIGEHLIASVDLPIMGHYTHASAEEPALGLGMILRPSVIASLILDPSTSRHARSAPAGLGVAQASPRLLDAVVGMVRLLDHPATAACGFQEQIRLRKSRLLLLTGADVATAGHQVGYDSASPFSRDYRRRFGLAPGRDAARLRARVGAA